MLLYIIIGYFLLVNFITFAILGIDKSKATRGKSRISEFTLLLFCFIGGAIGGAFGMKFFHHKTRKTGFRVKLIICFVFNLFAYGWLIFKYYEGTGIEIPWI